MAEGVAEGCRKFASATRYKMLLLLATSTLFIYLFVYYLSIIGIQYYFTSSYISSFMCII